ncbi:MAG: phosphatidylglycerol lysyltransferase domain-containing protein [Anaeromicrobium sp.]|jgi:hypothetical protein|uniref:DUF2156 domain-containing protein n=1 Tax=Anaeromicrobium sp. TaxID=1929132 RepID=UPI0025E45C85|nr:phosphatidylglycerol lysyltransferase domain-containing protein [Anaeromicrobium sp.]MCT4593756.1 phosphatidylglycerol lysyltransferase domain-containing protein [Anaeromicrobium sp.]
MFEKKISLEDKDLFEKYIYNNNHKTSGLSFTSLFMWKDVNDIRYEIINDYLCIRALNYLTEEGDPQYFVFPPLPLHKYNLDTLYGTLKILEDIFNENNQKLTIKLAPEEYIDYFKKINMGNVIIKEDRENFDYAYLSDNLANLKGRKYQSKRNHLNYFYRTYSFQYKPLTKDLIEECILLNDNLIENKVFENNMAEELIFYERNAIKEALYNMDTLDFKGGVILVNDKVEAFTLGYKINPNMMVVHIEKANPSIRGLYQAINQQFVQNECYDVTYVNREEDMGLESLRRAKLSYRPDEMIKKFDIEFR